MLWLVHRPPELLISLDEPRDVLRSLYLLPSLIHRLELIKLATQLPREACSPSNGCWIPPSLISEALIAKRCPGDAPFDPLHWLAPGQYTLHPVSCKCGVDIRKVPLTHLADIENNAIKFGVICVRVHRWLHYKTIADGLEALT
jgi:hypothetical protein